MITDKHRGLRLFCVAAAILCLFSTASAGADERLHTMAKKVTPFKRVVSLNGSTDKDYHRWRITCQRDAYIGMLVEFRTPEFCAAAALREAKSRLLDAADTDQVWQAFQKYQTDDKSVVFVGYLYFMANTYTLEQVKAAREFYLEIDGDKRYKPAELEFSPDDVHVNGSGMSSYTFGPFGFSTSNQVYVRPFIVRFANADKDDAPLLTPTTRSVALIVAGATFQGRARWEFPNQNKKQ